MSRGQETDDRSERRRKTEMTEDRGQMTEDRNDRKQKAEGRRQMIEYLFDFLCHPASRI